MQRSTAQPHLQHAKAVLLNAFRRLPTRPRPRRRRRCPSLQAADSTAKHRPERQHQGWVQLASGMHQHRLAVSVLLHLLTLNQRAPRFLGGFLPLLPYRLDQRRAVLLLRSSALRQLLQAAAVPAGRRVSAPVILQNQCHIRTSAQ